MFIKAKLTVLATAVALAAIAGTTTVHAAEGKGGLSGRWIMPDNSILTIRGSEWSHPAWGAATIHRTEGNTFRVDYHQHQGTGCTYRINTTASGDILVLEAADATQSFDFCPSGRFSRAD
jgi:hypothetical protein